MKNILTLELKKSLQSKSFIIALILMLTCALLSAAYMIENNARFNPYVIEQFAMQDGEFYLNPDIPLYGFYHSWVGGESLSLMYTVFFTLIPIAGALPFACSFFTERKNGYTKNIATRIHKKSYFLAKSIAVFISGALVVLIPLIVNIFVVSAFIPVYEPWVSYDMYNHIRFGTMWADIYYTMPLLYVILYILLDTIFAGLFGLISFSVTFYINNRFAILLLPFLTMLGMNYLERLLSTRYYQWTLEIVPTEFLKSDSMLLRTSGGVVFLVGLLMLSLAILTIWRRGVRYEIY